MAWGGNPMAARWNRLYKGTDAELSLEDAVAELGVPYRTQFPGFLYGFRFFPDFLLPTLGVVIEVDDDSHTRAKKRIEDAERTDFLEETQGWRVVRCTNDEALNDPRGAVRAMLEGVGMWPLPQRLPKLADAMPRPKKCPKKESREAKSAARQRKRGLA
jgi:very-short-patch-repair endonuclease